MFYCEGKNCSRKEQCAYNENFEWKYPRQCLDMSTEGYGYGGIDENGKSFCHHKYCCGDKADFYKRYKALGWREGQEYKNSEGTICDEVCLTCKHKNLCFDILEYAGMIFEPGDRIRFNCEDIKNNPIYYQNQIDNWLNNRIRWIKNGDCPMYKRDPPDGGFYG